MSHVSIPRNAGKVIDVAGSHGRCGSRGCGYPLADDCAHNLLPRTPAGKPTATGRSSAMLFSNRDARGADPRDRGIPGRRRAQVRHQITLPTVDLSWLPRCLGFAGVPVLKIIDSGFPPRLPRSGLFRVRGRSGDLAIPYTRFRWTTKQVKGFQSIPHNLNVGLKHATSIGMRESQERSIS